jgi:hypothetical protein
MAPRGYRRAGDGQKPADRPPATPAPQPEFLSTSEIADLAQRLTGKRPSPSTVTRWMLRGARGNRLPARRIGGRLFAPRGAALAWLGGHPAISMACESSDAAAVVASLLGRQWGTAAPPGVGRHGKGGAA